jgi:FlaG/FlaF family flagellin (archaellin)
VPSQPGPWLAAINAVRIVLVLAAAFAAWRAVHLHRTDSVRNPLPWAVLTILFITTTAMISVVP